MYVDEWTKCALRLNSEKALKIQNLHYKKLFKSYAKIMKSYDLFKKVFQISMSLILSYIWFVKNFVILTVCNIQCERFYIKVEDAQSVSLQLWTNSNCCKSQKFFGKKVFQRHRTFSKMTVCGLFHVDVMLPIRLLLLTTSYILYYIVEVVIHTLIYIQVATDVVKAGLINDNMISLKDIMFLTENSDLKKFCKNILHLYRANFTKILCLFYIDVCQVLRMASMTVNYTVVLLQFAFL
ncbi:hypothetical protein HF086_006411 [Spodoptera exigua]|uniref:Uncharacterized protein n=1 Tax=Spodoptera exigua TaxID=7107 RepID=A0A922MWS7_SPOEX|nr:hypothetical protein HF086_006411 [Spodoptera exigua]